MGHKLLFVMGIVVAHGALAAGLASDRATPRAVTVTTCVKSPDEPLHISPPLELLAYAMTHAEYEAKVMRP
jgi:hypothetical protein